MSAKNGIHVNIDAGLLLENCGRGWVKLPPEGVPEEVKIALGRFAGPEDQLRPSGSRLEVTDFTWTAVLEAVAELKKEKKRMERLGA